jgi:GST-like protein
MITLHAMASPNVQKVILALEEMELPYRIQRCGLVRGDQHAAAFRALNPNGKVPVIEDDEASGGGREVVFESGAILLYLAEKSQRFWPASGPGRWAAVEWLMFQMANLGPVFGHTIHLTSFAGAEHYACDRFLRESARLLDVADARLAQAPYLAGEDYSIADMAVFPWIPVFARFFPAALERPALAAWRETIALRPAAERMAKIAKDLGDQDRASFKGATPEQLDRYFGRTGPKLASKS